MTAEILKALADALDQASRVLRTHAALLDGPASSEPISDEGTNAVGRARGLHPQIGPRQVEVLQVLEDAGPEGTNTGVISSRIDYDQPNVYLTLRGLISRGFVVKDKTANPHIYRLAPVLLGH